MNQESQIKSFNPVEEVLPGWVRCKGGCPTCGGSKSNPSFSLLLDNRLKVLGGNCLKCNRFHSPEDLGFEPNDGSLTEKNEPIDPKVIKARDLYIELAKSNECNLMEEEFLKRGLDSKKIKSLPLYELDGKFLAYGFVNKKDEIVGINYRIYIDGEIKKLYLGKKSLGQGILKDGKSFVVGEGPFTVLAVHHVLSNYGVKDLGIIVSGDANNLKKLANEHRWALLKAKKIYVASDYDSSGVGQEAAYAIARAFPGKTKIYLPPRYGVDWSDLLMDRTILEYL